MHMWQWFIAILAACFYLGLASAGFWASLLRRRLTHRTGEEAGYASSGRQRLQPAAAIARHQS
jgi:hypothetical protein